MYETYWNLKEKPFCNIVDKKYFYYGETYEEAYLRLMYTVTESKGLMVLSGEGGVGKSFICKNLMQEIAEQGYRVAFITHPNLEPLEFLQQVVIEFGMEFKGKTKVELLRDLKNFIHSNAERGRLSLLIIDDAHLIQNPETLEEIRLLLNFESENNYLLSIILVGKPGIREVINKNSSLRERIGLQYRLQMLSCKETGEYIYFRLKKAESEREIFNPEAVEEIYKITRGIPREINNLCDMALLLGYGDNAVVVDEELIKKSAEDLRGNSFYKPKNSS